MNFCASVDFVNTLQRLNLNFTWKHFGPKVFFSPFYFFMLICPVNVNPLPTPHLFSQGCHCCRQHLHLRPSSRWRPEEVKKQNLRGNEMEFGQETCSAGLDSKNIFLICLDLFLNPSTTYCWNCSMSWLFVWLHHCTLNIRCTWHVAVVANLF